jgi:serine/threonine-protein phosphatase 4 catalytic subunit
MQAKYSSLDLYDLINDLFDFLPFAAVVDSRLFCVHGGLDPKLSYVSKLPGVDRRVEPELGSLVGGLLWSDPSESITEWTRSDRRSGYFFNSFHTKKFLEINGLQMVVRSHEMADGYKIMHGGLLVTIWSAPNYCYLCGNKAGVLKVTGDGEDSYFVYDAMPEARRKKPKPVLLAAYYFQ